MNSLLERGAFILSVDTEMGGRSAHDPMCQEIISLLLELMERYKIHATWAIQGSLLPKSHGVNGENQPPIVAPGDRKSASTEALTGKLGTSVNKIPSWNGKNVIQQILGCKTSQEIGCHTISHIRVGDSSSNQEQFEAELKVFQQELDKFDLTLYSFVFPWNTVGYVDSLRKYGFLAYRGPSANWYAKLPAYLQRLAYPLDHWLLIPPNVTKTSCENGVWNLQASYFYVIGAGWGKMIPTQLRVMKAKEGLRLAVKKHRLFHLWFHPFNLVKNTEAWLKGLESIFAEVSRYREKGLLENLTMGEAAIKLEKVAKGNK